MRRIALLIGINKYPRLDPSFTLTGCVNDQLRLKGLLTERFGFRERDVKTLFDEGATRDNILDALDRLAGMGRYEGQAGLDGETVLFIGYSGHGSRLKEPENGPHDEADGYDSTIVPFDSDRPRPTGKGGKNLDITDDELRARFEKISERAGHLVLYFDCCHSGTISRDLEGEVAGRSIPEADTGYDDVERLQPEEAGSRDIETRGRTGWLPMSRERYVLIAGCADDEKARELSGADGQRYGALTHHFAEAMAQLAGPATYRDLYERARTPVTARFPTQHPQIEGSDEQQLFGLTAAEVAPFARVSERLDDRRVRLSVGRMHGVREGWRFELQPLALGESTRLAEVTVTSVGDGSCEAAADSSLPASVVQGCRALPTARPMGVDAMPVAIQGDAGEAADRLRALLEKEPRVRLVEPRDAALAAVLLPAREEAKEDDLAPELGALAEPTWVLVAADRSLYGATPQRASEVATVAENIGAWAGAWNVARLGPPAGSPLFGKAAIQVLAHSADGQHTPLPLDEKSGLPVATAGQPIVIELRNTSGGTLWMTFIDVGLMGSVTIPLPSEQLGTTPFRLGDDGQINLDFPKGFPPELNAGRESLVLILTEKQQDFTLLMQEGARELAGLSARSTPTDNAWASARADLIVRR